MRLLSSLMVISSVLISCGGVKPFPATMLYELDMKNHVCGEYQMINSHDVKYKWVRDVPLAQCPSMFGYTPSELAKIQTWARDVIIYTDNHCKE